MGYRAGVRARIFLVDQFIDQVFGVIRSFAVDVRLLE